MNSMTIVLLVIAGLVLVYAAIKGEDPREVVKKALSRTKQATAGGRAGSGLGR
jgi:hypothetical protein